MHAASCMVGDAMILCVRRHVRDGKTNFQGFSLA